MNNYYITDSGQQIEIFDKKVIDLYKLDIIKLVIKDQFILCELLDASSNSLKEITLDLPNCKLLFLDNNKLKKINLNIEKCETLDLSANCLESFNDFITPKLNVLFLNNNKLGVIKLNIPHCLILESDPETRFIQDNGNVIKSSEGFSETIYIKPKYGEVPCENINFLTEEKFKKDIK